MAKKDPPEQNSPKKDTPTAPNYPPYGFPEGYLCTCGFADPDYFKLGAHVRVFKKKEPGKHESRGKWNLQTMEQLSKPEKDLTPEEKAERARKYKEQTKLNAQQRNTKEEKGKTKGNTKENQGTPKNDKGDGKGGSDKIAPSQFTSNYKLASRMQFVPRVMTVDLTPQLISGYECAKELWGWNVSFGEYLNIINENFFLDRGIELGKWIIRETEEERAARLKAEEGKNGEGTAELGELGELTEVTSEREEANVT